jgi:fructokinase
MNKAPSTRFVVAGEALIDLLQQSNGTLVPKLGGSPWNLARALGRLGCNVDYINPLSTDYYGQQLARELELSQVKLTGGRSFLPTSLALVRIRPDGQPDYSFYREGVADRDIEPLSIAQSMGESVQLFHIGSLSLLPPDGAAWAQLLNAILAQGICTSIDINMRPMVAKDKEAYTLQARALLNKGVIIKVSDEDLNAMHLEGEPLNVARKLINDVTQVVILTLGERGAWCLTQEHEHFQPPASVRVVDTVGAGDCFYAGFLAKLAELGHIKRYNYEPFTIDCMAQAMSFGNSVTAKNLQQVGCEPPWRHEL